MMQDTNTAPDEIRRLADQLRATRAARLADPSMHPTMRQMMEAQQPTTPKPTLRRKRKVSVPDNVDPNHPIMLEAAARLGFPDGSMTVSGLCNEIRKGNLHASKMAGRIYVTLNEIQQMRERCNIGAGDEVRERNSTSANQSGPVAQGDGSSSTPHRPGSASSEALAHLQMIAQRLKKPLPDTSPESTSPTSAVVIPLKS